MPVIMTNAPSIIFSYNLLDVRTNKKTCWLIDKKGKIKKVEEAMGDVAHQSDYDLYSLRRLYSESIETSDSVQIEDLESHFNQLSEKDTVSASSLIASRYETTMYGYFLNRSDDNSCSCSNKPKPSDAEIFEFRLLQQKLDDDIIINNGVDIVAWIESLDLESI